VSTANPDSTHLRLSSKSPTVPWWRMPFTADTWRRTLYALLVLPVAIISLPLAILGGSAIAARLQRGLAHALLGMTFDEVPYRKIDGRVVGHSLLGLVHGTLSAVLAGYLWLIAVVNVAYPLRPDTADLSTAWGGPSLAGAWLVHGSGGIIFLFATPWVVKGITHAQGRLLRWMLGSADRVSSARTPSV
jgi:hypothetical protein